MITWLQKGDIIDSQKLVRSLAGAKGAYQTISVASHSAAILVVHQMSDDADEGVSSKACEAYTEMLILQDRLAKLMFSYNPELLMGPGMAAEFEDLRANLDRVYREIVG